MGSGLGKLDTSANGVDFSQLNGMTGDPTGAAQLGTAMGSVDPSAMPQSIAANPLMAASKNALQGAGKGLQQWGQQASAKAPARGGGGGQAPVAQPQVQNNFDPNFLLKYLQGNNGGGANSNLLFGGQ